MPFPDALQEFRTETGVRPARYGMYTGATVNAVTRSGTNKLHGSLFEFARHHSLNAIPYFNQTEHGGLGGDDGLVRHQAGGSAGGALLKDKLFFFGGLQYTNQKITPLTTNQIVPTQEVLRGDFRRIMSAACRGGTARTLGAPYVDNQINPALFSPFALQLLRFIPTADPAYDPDGCGRYPLAIPNDSVEQQVIGRLDYQVNTNNRVFGRYFFTQLQPRRRIRQPVQSESVVREWQRAGNQEPHAHVRWRLGSGDHASVVRLVPRVARRHDRTPRAGQRIADVHDAGRQYLSVHEQRWSELLQWGHRRMERQRLSWHVLHHDAVAL